MKFAFPLIVLYLTTACGHLTTQCLPPEPIPQELRVHLEPLRTATDASDIMPAHLYNMERCGVCYSKYEALRKATEDE